MRGIPLILLAFCLAVGIAGTAALAGAGQTDREAGLNDGQRTDDGAVRADNAPTAAPGGSFPGPTGLSLVTTGPVRATTYAQARAYYEAAGEAWSRAWGASDVTLIRQYLVEARTAYTNCLNTANAADDPANAANLALLKSISTAYIDLADAALAMYDGADVYTMGRNLMTAGNYGAAAASFRDASGRFNGSQALFARATATLQSVTYAGTEYGDGTAYTAVIVPILNTKAAYMGEFSTYARGWQHTALAYQASTVGDETTFRTEATQAMDLFGSLRDSTAFGADATGNHDRLAAMLGGESTLVGTWQLTSYLAANGETAPAVAGSNPLVAFTADGRVGGSAGCNHIGGNYTADGDRLTIGSLVTTVMYCTAPGVMDQEQRVFELLGLTAGYSISEPALTLLDRGGRPLMTFRRAAEPIDAPLTGTTWRLAGFTDHATARSALAGSNATVVFGDDGRLRGTTGCNEITGPYSTSGDAITIGPLSVTDRACADPSLAAQEWDLLEALEAAATLDIQGDRLTLTDASRTRSVEFVRAA